MRYLFVVAFVALAFSGYCSGSVVPTNDVADGNAEDIFEDDTEIELGVDFTDGTVEIAPQFVLSWQARRFIRNFQKAMPCGFPELGVPPLAPLKKREAEIKLEKGILRSITELLRLRVDGLNDFDVKRFKLNIFKKKIIFDFLFKNIRASASEYNTDTFVDAMRELGITVQYEGNGSLDFGLKNLRIAGTLRYKLPVLWGSAKITSLKTTVTLEKCNSNIDFKSNSFLNGLVNPRVEQFLEAGINENQQQISDAIESNLVPKINKMLKGKDFWTVIEKIFPKEDSEQEVFKGDDSGNANTVCVPPSDPWE